MNKERLKKFYPFAMFCTLGTINAGIYFLLFTFFLEYLKLNYLVAASITYVITAAFQFFSNRKLTFKSSGNVGYQMFKYFILLGINYCVSMAVLHGIVEKFSLSPYIGLCCSVLSSALMSFFLLKFWVFRHPSALVY